jgi:hypothetical protein
MNRSAILFLFLIVVSGCSKRVFMFTSVPGNSLVTVNSKRDTTGITETVYIKDPAEVKLFFLGKGDAYRIMANHRGYVPVSRIISKDSALKMTLAMQRVEGVSEIPYDTTKLLNASFLLLKPDIDITIRSGLGNFTKLNHSDELSRQATDSVYYFLEKTVNNTPASFLPLKYSETSWNEVDPILVKYLVTLNGAKLPYYTYPPNILQFIKADTILLSRLSQASKEYRNPYFVYVWAKCVKESKGRIIGNIALTAAAAGVQGYNQAMGNYYSTNWDPSAFTLQTGTKIVYFVIDPNTLEVVKIDQNYYDYDLTSTKNRKAFVNEILQYPKTNKR